MPRAPASSPTLVGPPPLPGAQHLLARGAIPPRIQKVTPVHGDKTIASEVGSGGAGVRTLPPDLNLADPEAVTAYVLEQVNETRVVIDRAQRDWDKHEQERIESEKRRDRLANAVLEREKARDIKIDGLIDENRFTAAERQQIRDLVAKNRQETDAALGAVEWDVQGLNRLPAQMAELTAFVKGAMGTMQADVALARTAISELDQRIGHPPPGMGERISNHEQMTAAELEEFKKKGSGIYAHFVDLIRRYETRKSVTLVSAGAAAAVAASAIPEIIKYFAG